MKKWIREGNRAPAEPSRFSPIIFSPSLFTSLRLSSLDSFLLKTLDMALSANDGSLFIFFLKPSISPIVAFPENSLFISPNRSAHAELFKSGIIRLPSITSISDAALPVMSDTNCFSSIAVLGSFGSPIVAEVRAKFTCSIVTPKASRILLI